MTDETDKTETEAGPDETGTTEAGADESAKTDKDPQLPEDEQKKLEHLDEEIKQARQHLKEQTHEGEETFITEGGPADEAETDNTIAPPG